MLKGIRIGTRESPLALRQAMFVQELLKEAGETVELIGIKSDGDIDLKTPLYEMQVQGIFTRSLDVALLNDKIDVAVHSMKDVPTQLPPGIIQSAVLKRGSYKDLLVYKNDPGFLSDFSSRGVIGTSSIRRKAQWLNRYPNHTIENLRGSVNTRIQKLHNNDWNGAIFAAAGLQRIELQPETSIELDWMLPAPAQGAIVVMCRSEDDYVFEACNHFNDANTALCTKIERDFLRALLGGCSAPIGALAEMKDGEVHFKGNILSPDGRDKIEIERKLVKENAINLGKTAGEELLRNGGKKIAESINKLAS